MSSQAEDLSQFDGISREEKEKLVGEVIRHVLFKSHQNSGCPLRREELTQIVTRNYRHRNLPTLVINEAGAKLSSVFGYRLVELHRSRPSSTNQPRALQSSAADNKSYVLMSELPDDLYRKHVEDADTFLWSGLAFVVISVVHLAGGKIQEDNLWHHLRRLGLYENDENHEHFGNLKQALESLVSQRYLQKSKVAGPEGSIFLYELAERALDAKISDKIKEYILQKCIRAALLDANVPRIVDFCEILREFVTGPVHSLTGGSMSMLGRLHNIVKKDAASEDAE